MIDENFSKNEKQNDSEELNDICEECKKSSRKRFSKFNSYRF